MSRWVLFALSLASAVPAGADSSLSGKAIKILDGDTLIIVTAQGDRQARVRLAQIDAPETSQAFGQRSKQSLSDLVYGKGVQVAVEKTDQYGRLIGVVHVDNLDANLEQVKRGMAWVYPQYAKDPSYFAAERTARDAKTGLWAQSDPTSPWKFRHSAKPSSVIIKPGAEYEDELGGN
ncbi:thermonuclease family protein [Methylogaea oryzae]|uniref:Endonuclease n=1 Tax=Methylogaea oryzae TaxID=1295382 RepID=A0A8D4VP85_9GAMM|nr:thermonuclease family protein [Methylogaea oryzae]BBL70839.1 putative endonuclease [Methylogaea oryzae]